MRSLPLLLAVLFLLSGCTSIQGSLYDFGIASERSRAGLQALRVTIQGQQLHFLERAGDRPHQATLVLIHGFAGNKDHWVRLVPHLPSHYRVLVPDLPGHGDNAPDTMQTYDIAHLTAAVWGLVEARTEGSVVLVGNSLGGRVTAELALDHPDRVRALVLLDPAGVPAPEPSALDQALLRGENWLIPTTPAEYDSLTAIAFGDDPPDLPWPAEAVVARRYAARAFLYRAVWRDLGPDFSTLPPRLPSLSVPTLLLWGSEDGILHPSAAARWAELVPEITVELLEGVGHAPMLEQPEATAHRIAEFLRSLGN
ncbi:MAG: alpha/beta fold hydrolase [Rhodothermaceae bacterium]|nr:alpha/beta fold hydrolase [Rhodothermaceae bacterium]